MRHRDQLEDTVFRWARTEMKKEKVMASSSYAKLAGLQSEIGRVVVTRVAGSELEYKRMLNSYRQDMTMNVNNIRREQIKMRKTMVRYVKKLKETRQENLKRQREEEARDAKRRSLEAIQLGLRFDVSSASVTPATGSLGGSGGPVSPSMVDYTEDEVSADKETDNLVDGDEARDKQSDDQLGSTSGETNDSFKTNSDANGHGKEIRPYDPILPMINEDKENEEEEEQDNVPEIRTHHAEKSVTLPDIENNLLRNKIIDDEMSISSNGRRRKSKKEVVSFSDIMKLRYSSNHKQLFNMVNILARKHGITNPEQTIPDPRDSVVLRGSTNDSLRLQAATLYSMKYGYSTTEADPSPPSTSPPPLQRGPHPLSSSTDTLSSRMSSDVSKKDCVGDRRRSSSVSMENVPTTHGGAHTERMRKMSEPRMRGRDSSMTLLVEKVANVKRDQTGRRLSEADQMFKTLMSAKPSSSRSTKSLPPLTKLRPRVEDKAVSWTQAVGLLRAIHSLDNVAT